MMKNGCNKRTSGKECIGRKIASIRQEAGMSQAELGKKCGLERFHISRIESGRHSVGFDTLAAIAKALGKTIDFV